MKPTEGFAHPATDRVLTVEIVDWYGRRTIKPACDLSRKFAALLGQKTLTEANCARIKELGYIIRTEGKML